MSQLSIAARLSLNADQFLQQAQQAKRETDALADELRGVSGAGSKASGGMKKTGAAAKKLKNEEKRLEQQTKQTHKSLVSMGTFIGGALAVAMYKAAGSAKDAIVEYEKFKGQLETTFKGSEQLAGDAFKAIESFAKETPFTLNQSIEAFVKLRNLGIAPTRALMESMGNTSSAMGKDLNQYMEAIADAATGEFERLKEFGVKASTQGNKVAFTFQGMTTSVGKNSKEIVAYLQSIGETEFAGSMERQMERLPGQISNLEDNFGALWRGIGDQGATAFATAAISGLSGAVGDLATMVSSGYLAEAFNAQFAGWIDVVGDVKGYLGSFLAWANDTFFGHLYELFTGKELTEGDNGFVKLAKLIWDSFIDLPENLAAIFAILIGEADKFRLSAIEKFELFQIATSETWLNVQRFGEVAFEALELAAAISVDAIIESFGAMVGGIGDSLDALPDALVPDSWLEGVKAAEAGILAAADGEAVLRAEMAQSQAAYESQLATMNQQREAIKQTYAQRRAGADSAIASALEERDAALEAKDVQMLYAEDLLETARAAKVTAEEHDRLATANMKVAETAKTASKEQLKAAAKADKAAQKNLERVISGVESEREKVESWYADQVAALDEAERLKLDSTKSYADLRAQVQAQYHEKLSEANKRDQAEYESKLVGQLESSSIFGNQLVGMYNEWGELQSELWNGNVDSAKDSFDNILDSFVDMLKQMAANWAISGIAGLISGDGFDGFNMDAFMGGSGGGSGGDIGGLIGGLFGGGGASTPGFNGSTGGRSNSGGFGGFGNIEVGNGNLGDARGLAGGVMGAYNGIQQGGVGGYMSAAAGAYKAYNSGRNIGLWGDQLQEIGVTGKKIKSFSELEGGVSAASLGNSAMNMGTNFATGWLSSQIGEEIGGTTGQVAQIAIDKALQKYAVPAIKDALGIAKTASASAETASAVANAAAATSAAATTITAAGTAATGGTASATYLASLQAAGMTSAGAAGTAGTVATGATAGASAMASATMWGAIALAASKVLNKPIEKKLGEDRYTLMGDMDGYANGGLKGWAKETHRNEMYRTKPGAVIKDAFRMFGVGSRSKNQIFEDEYQNSFNDSNIGYGLGNTGLVVQGSYHYGGARAAEFGEFAKTKGLDVHHQDGMAKVRGAGGAIGEDVWEQQIKPVLDEWNANAGEYVLASEDVLLAVQQNNFDDHKLFADRLTTMASTTIEQLATDFVAVDELFDGYVEKGMAANEAVYQSVSEVLNISLEAATVFVDESGVAVETWAQNFKDGTGEAIAAMLAVDEAGHTAFEGVAASTELSIMGIEGFKVNLSGLAEPLASVPEQFSSAFGAANDEVLSAASAMADGVKGQFNGFLSGIDLGNFNVPALNVPTYQGGGATYQGIEHLNTGKQRIHSDGLIYAHKNEMIIDPRSAAALRDYGINVNTSGGGDSRSMAALEAKLDQVVAAVDRVTQAQHAGAGHVANTVKKTNKGGIGLSRYVGRAAA